MHFAKRLVIATVVVFALIFLRLAYAPTSISFLADSIIEPFGKAFPGKSLSYDGVFLVWNMDRTSFEVSLENAKIENTDGSDFASFPKITVDFDGFSLLVGVFIPEGIDFYGSDLNLAWSANALQQKVDLILAREKEPEIEIRDKPPVLEFMEKLLAGEKEDSPLRSLKAINIREARLTLTETDSGIVWQIPDANLGLVRRNFGLSLEADLNFFSQGEAVFLGIESGPDEKGNTRIALNMQGLNLAALAEEVGLTGIFTSINMPLYGNINVIQNQLGGIQALEFDFGGGPGTVFYEPFQSSPAAFEDLVLKAVMDPLSGLVEIAEIRLAVDDAVISGSGFLEYFAEYPKPGIRMSFRGDNLGIPTLMKLWPPVPESGGRKWINENIPRGTLQNMSVEVAFAPDTFESRPLPNDVMHMSGDFEGGEIHFLRPMPPMKDAKGYLTLQGNGMQATVTSGTVDGMEIAGIDFEIEDMTVRKQQLGHATIRLDGQVDKIMTLLDQEPLRIFSERNLNPEDYFGDATTVTRLHVPLYSGADPDLTDYTVEATIENAAVPSLMADGGLSEGRFTLTATPSGLVANGMALLKRAPFDFYWTQDFEAGTEFSTRVELNGSLADEDLHRFGIPEDVTMDGTARVYVSLRGDDGDLKEAQGTIDFFNAKVMARKMDWYKDANRPSEGSFEVAWVDADLVVRNVKINSRELRLDAAFIFDAETGIMKRADVPLFVSGGNDLTATAQQTADGILDVTVQARTLNAIPFIETMFEDSGGETFAPDMKMTLRADETTTMNEVFFRNLSVDALKRQEYWVDANLLGAVDDGGIFQVAIASRDGGRSLRIESDNAGRAALGTNVFRNGVGGRLLIEAEMNVFQDPLFAEGTLTATDIKLVKSSVLIQALAEDERSGLDEMIKESGVDFADVSIPFKLENEIFDISSASAAGPSLGFTMEGQVTQDFERMNLNGTVVPAYTLNTIISRIPIIGTILMGGKGEGLFALNYRIEGTREEPDVTFNAASALTPGILRKLVGNKKGELPPEEEAAAEPEVSDDPALEAGEDVAPVEAVADLAEAPLPEIEDDSDGEGDT